MAKKSLTVREYVRAIASVAATSFRYAPSAAIVRIVDSIIYAALPVAMTYFAAETTTALAAAYSGAENALNETYFYVAMTALVSVAMLAWSSISNYISQLTRYKVESTVEDAMMRHFTSLPFHMYDDKEVMDLHEKARRFSSYFSYIFNSLGGMFSSIIGVIIAVVALSSVAWWIPLVILAIVIPEAVIQIRLAKKQANHWNTNITMRRRRNNINWMLQESRYIAELRVYGVAKHLIKVHASLRDKDEKERLKFEGNIIWKQLGADILQAIVEFSILIWAVLQIANRTLPIGQFILVQQLVSRSINEASSFARQLGNIDQDLANIVDYRDFMDLPTKEDSGKLVNDIPSEITLSNVSFKYPKTETDSLSNVSLTIKRKQKIAIVGENGAGKSTLVKILLGLYVPSSGNITIDNTLLHDYSLVSWHKYIGLLWQDVLGYSFATIRENITLGDPARPVDAARYAAALRDGEMDTVIKKLPHNDDTYIERWMAEDDDDSTATELSGGQYQRLAISRNFYRDSPILILDEPTSAIDALAEARIFKKIFELHDKTVIIVSHRYTTIKKADAVYVMNNGRIVESGSAKDLIRARGQFYEMFKEQIK